MRRWMTAALILAATVAFAYDLNHVPLSGWYVDGLHFAVDSTLTGTWTATVGSPVIVRASGAAAIETELAVGDYIVIGGYGYEVTARADGTADADTITIQPTIDPATNARRLGATATVTGGAVYVVNVGADSALRSLEDGAGTSTALSLSTTTVGAAALEVGGSYAGGSGATISADGVGQFNGALTVDGAAALNGGISVDSPAFVVTDTTGAVSTASTVTATNYRTSTAAAGLGTANGLSLGNNGVLLDGATGGGNTLTVGWPTYADASDGAITNAEFLVSQPGSAWYNDSTLTNGQSGFRYKVSGNVSGALDADGTILTSTFTDSASANLTGSILSITRANVLDAGGGDGQRALEITVPDASGAVSTGAGNAIYISDLRAGVENDATAEASIYVATTGSYSIYATRGVQTATSVEAGTYVAGPYFSASAGTSPNWSVNYVVFGNANILLEGATDDADELKLSYPTYSDGGAGDQGGEYDATGVIRSVRETTVTISDAGVGVTPYTLTPTAYTSAYVLTCSDADGCALTLAEVDLGSVAIHGGHCITIVAGGANVLTITDSAGVQETVGGSWASDSAADNVTMCYSTALAYWYQTAEADL